MDTSPLDSYSRALESFLQDDYANALCKLSEAEAMSGSVEEKAKYQASKAMCLLRMLRPRDALQAANASLEVSSASFLAHYVKAQALFHTQEFDRAKTSFQKASASLPLGDPRGDGIVHWIRKCDAELSGSFLALKGTYKVVNERKPFKLDPPDSTAKSEWQTEKREPESHETSPTPPKRTEVEPLASPPPACPPDTGVKRGNTKWDWMQSEGYVTVTIRAKKRRQADITTDFAASSLSCTVKLSSSDQFVLDLDLWGLVNPQLCRVDLSEFKVDVVLAKKEKGVQWLDIERKQLPTDMQPSAYPSSSNKKKNWQDMDKMMDQELEGEQKDDPNILFKQIFANADPETRRAMVKSYQTSGGTVLSTNWGEVKKADYEGKDKMDPPQGQEWKKW